MAFNIVLHVIFVKLSFELSRMATPALLLIIFTIGVNYFTTMLFSVGALGNMLDPSLVGVGTRSVFNLNSFLLLVGVVGIISFMEHLVNYLRLFKQIKGNHKTEFSKQEQSS